MTTHNDLPFSPLIAQIMEQNARHTASTTNAVIDGLTARALNAEATVAAIRCTVLRLLNGPFQPTPALIEEALYPSAEEITLFREDSGR